MSGRNRDDARPNSFNDQQFGHSYDSLFLSSSVLTRQTVGKACFVKIQKMSGVIMKIQRGNLY